MGLPNVILSKHTYSSFPLQGGLARKPLDRNELRSCPSTLLTSRGGEGAAPSLSHFCTCFMFDHVKSTNSFIFDFPPRCLPTTSSRHGLGDVQPGPQTALQPGLRYGRKAVLA